MTLPLSRCQIDVFKHTSVEYYENQSVEVGVLGQLFSEGYWRSVELMEGWLIVGEVVSEIWRRVEQYFVSYGELSCAA